MQTGSLAASRHNLNVCLPAHTAVVAAADPIGGQLAAAKTLQESVKLAPSLLASFDLIFELKVQQNLHTNQGIASQALRLGTGEATGALCQVNVSQACLPDYLPSWKVIQRVAVLLHAQTCPAKEHLGIKAPQHLTVSFKWQGRMTERGAH